MSDVEGVTERLELAQRMITLARTGGPADAELWGRLWRIDAALQLGRIDVVDDELGQLAMLAERLGWPIAWWHQHRMTGARLLLAGRFADAEAAADRADAEARRTEDITALHIGGALRGEILRLTGRYGEAVERLRAIREASACGGMPIFLASAGLTSPRRARPTRPAGCSTSCAPLLPRQPRDGRWIGTVAGAGLLAALLEDEPTVAWCLDQLHAVRRLLPRGRVGLGALRRVGQPGDGLPRGGARAAPRRPGACSPRRSPWTSASARCPTAVLSEVALAWVHAAAGERTAAEGVARRAADTARRIGMPPALAAAEEAVGAASAPSATPPTR